MQGWAYHCTKPFTIENENGNAVPPDPHRSTAACRSSLPILASNSIACAPFNFLQENSDSANFVDCHHDLSFNAVKAKFDPSLNWDLEEHELDGLADDMSLSQMTVCCRNHLFHRERFEGHLGRF
jgi:hypothetical protein